MIVKLKNVLPNPFRDMERYPVHEKKIALLKKSIKSTDFWENVVVRKSEEHAGKIELAYGHHRLTALRELYDPEKEFNWIVRDLDDTQMIKMMADENAAEWGNAADIERETVRAIVTAYADNRIAMNAPKGRTNPRHMRFAPSFCLKQESTSLTVREVSPYTAESIASFIETLTTDAVQYTLRMLCLVEQGHIKEDKLIGLTTIQCKIVVAQISKSLNDAETIREDAHRESMQATPEGAVVIKQQAEERATQLVAETAKSVSDAVRVSTKAAGEAGRKVRAASKKKDEEIPEINEAAKRVTHDLHRLLNPGKHPASKLDEMVKFKSHLSDVTKQNLIVGLEVTIEYAQGYISHLKR